MCSLTDVDSLSHCLSNSLKKTTKVHYQDDRNSGLYSNLEPSECKSVHGPLKRTR